MDFTIAAALLELCEGEGLSLAQAMTRREASLMDTPEPETRRRLAHSLEIMKNAAATALAAPQKTMGGLIGGEAVALEKRRAAGRSACGSMMARAAAIAMGTLEVNASMGLIVAAPTAGSCGVLPGTLLAQAEEFGFSDEELIDALLAASAVGYLIARNATIAGAQGAFPLRFIPFPFQRPGPSPGCGRCPAGRRGGSPHTASPPGPGGR